MCLCNFVAVLFFFFFNDTATTEIYTLSLHDAPPMLRPRSGWRTTRCRLRCLPNGCTRLPRDRKSTRLNPSHMSISYADFCLKKKKKKNIVCSLKKKKKKKKKKIKKKT